MAAPMMSSAGKNLNSMMAREAGGKEKVVEKMSKRISELEGELKHARNRCQLAENKATESKLTASRFRRWNLGRIGRHDGSGDSLCRGCWPPHKADSRPGSLQNCNVS